MRNILFGKKGNNEDCILLKCQCHKRQRKAEELFQIKRDWKDTTTKSNMWSKTASSTGQKEKSIKAIIVFTAANGVEMTEWIKVL